MLIYETIFHLDARRSSTSVRHRVLTLLSTFPRGIRLIWTLALTTTLILTGCTAASPDPSQEGTDVSSPSASGDQNNPDDAAEKEADPPEETSVDAPDALPITITESGWWAKDSYAHYGVMVHNGNDSLAAIDTVIVATLYDQNGQELSESRATIALIGPGETIGFAGTAGDGWAPASVDLHIEEDSTHWQAAAGYAEPLKIEGYAEQDKLYFRYEITGTVTNCTDSYMSTVPLSILLRDESGAIIAGYTGEAYRLKENRTKDFLVTMHSAPEHATTEVYAQPH